jgi:hypothetical protein
MTVLVRFDRFQFYRLIADRAEVLPISSVMQNAMHCRTPLSPSKRVSV